MVRICPAFSHAYIFPPTLHDSYLHFICLCTCQDISKHTIASHTHLHTRAHDVHTLWTDPPEPWERTKLRVPKSRYPISFKVCGPLLVCLCSHTNLVSASSVNAHVQQRKGHRPLFFHMHTCTHGAKRAYAQKDAQVFMYACCLPAQRSFLWHSYESRRVP
jgi:hypothetical protein